MYHHQSLRARVRGAEDLVEACDLVEAGFEYVTDIADKKLFRKRK